MAVPEHAGVRIELRGIVKRFGPVQVLHGIDLGFEPGRVYGLLGENGAGKSTRHLEIQYTPLGDRAGLIGAGVLAMQESLRRMEAA